MTKHLYKLRESRIADFAILIEKLSESYANDNYFNEILN